MVRPALRTTLVAVWLLATPAFAECIAPDLDGLAPSFRLSLPTPPDPGLRPNRPECLGDPDDPSGENCPRDVISAYGAAVDAYIDALRQYVDETTRFANAAAEFANAAVAHAQGAGGYADAAYDWANCEADEISGKEE
jgi:hypothetical protein